MKKLYWTFLAFLTLGLSLVVVYFALQPGLTVIIPTQVFNSPEEAGQVASEKLADELDSAPFIIFGLMEQSALSLEVWEGLLTSSGLFDSEKVRFILPDFYKEELGSLQNGPYGEASFVSSIEYVAEVRAAVDEGFKVISLLPTPLASRLGPNEQTTRLQAELPGKVLTISLAPLAVDRASLVQLPGCNREPSPSSALTDLACAIQFRSRSALQKNFSATEIVGTLEKYGPSEYLFFLHHP